MELVLPNYLAETIEIHETPSAEQAVTRLPPQYVLASYLSVVPIDMHSAWVKIRQKSVMMYYGAFETCVSSLQGESND